MSIDLEKRSTKSVKVVASVTNIPAAFSFSNPASLVLTPVSNAQHIAVLNYTTSRLQVAFKTGSDSSNPTQTDFYVPEGTLTVPSALVFDDAQIEGHVFIASDTGAAITAGTVIVNVF
jgi:outer membrane protein assembly factor BamB